MYDIKHRSKIIALKTFQSPSMAYCMLISCIKSNNSKDDRKSILWPVNDKIATILKQFERCPLKIPTLWPWLLLADTVKTYSLLYGNKIQLNICTFTIYKCKVWVNHNNIFCESYLQGYQHKIRLWGTPFWLVHTLGKLLPDWSLGSCGVELCF